MVRVRSYIPLQLISQCRASAVSPMQRLTNLLFGSPNARRANGIISTRLDICGFARRVASKVTGRSKKPIPVFEIDRAGFRCSESLPRIWLSERISNTRKSDGARLFVECYPSSPDYGGHRALELGDAYLGEGANRSGTLTHSECIECFKAAEILYLHAVRRGNRIAAARLRQIYREDLCEGDYFTTYLEATARHARARKSLR